MASAEYITVSTRQQHALTTPHGATGCETFDPVDAHAKTLHAADGVAAMAVSGASVWLALANGGIEVRDAHSGIAQHTFTAPAARRPSATTRIWCLLAVYDADAADIARGVWGTQCCDSNNDAVATAATLAALSGTPRGEPQMWVGLSTGAIEVYHARTFTLLRQLRKHLSGVYCLAADQASGALMGNDSRCVYSGSSDFQIVQWCVRDGGLLRVFTGHANYVRCLYAEGAALVSGSDDGTVRVWDRATGETLRMGTFHILANSGTGAGNTNMTTEGTNNNGKPKSDHVANPRAPVTAQRSGVSVLCRVGVHMWSGDESGSVVVWRLSDCVAALVSRPHTARIGALRKIGSLVYSSAADCTICVFSALDGTLSRRLRMEGDASPMCGSGSSLGTGAHPQRQPPHRHGARVTALQAVVEVARHYLWTAAADNTVRCWHHDDHLPMTDDRERFHDMRWYYTSTQPFLAANEALLAEQRELTELVVLSSGSDDAIRAYLARNGAESQSFAAQYWQLQTTLIDSQRRTQQAEEERRAVEAAIAEKRRVLEVARANLQRMAEEQRSLRAAVGLPPSPPPFMVTAATATRTAVPAVVAPAAPVLAPMAGGAAAPGAAPVTVSGVQTIHSTLPPAPAATAAGELTPIDAGVPTLAPLAPPSASVPVVPPAASVPAAAIDTVTTAATTTGTVAAVPSATGSSQLQLPPPPPARQSIPIVPTPPATTVLPVPQPEPTSTTSGTVTTTASAPTIAVPLPAATITAVGSSSLSPPPSRPALGEAKTVHSASYEPDLSSMPPPPPPPPGKRPAFAFPVPISAAGGSGGGTVVPTSPHLSVALSGSNIVGGGRRPLSAMPAPVPVPVVAPTIAPSAQGTTPFVIPPPPPATVPPKPPGL